MINSDGLDNKYNKVDSILIIMWDFFTATVKVASLGIINIHNNGSVAIKDPITGTGNMLAGAYSHIVHNIDKGVWLGKRPMKDIKIGLSSYALSGFNSDIMHYAIRVDG